MSKGRFTERRIYSASPTVQVSRPDHLGRSVLLCNCLVRGKAANPASTVEKFLTLSVVLLCCNMDWLFPVNFARRSIAEVAWSVCLLNTDENLHPRKAFSLEFPVTVTFGGAQPYFLVEGWLRFEQKLNTKRFRARKIFSVILAKVEVNGKF